MKKRYVLYIAITIICVIAIIAGVYYQILGKKPKKNIENNIVGNETSQNEVQDPETIKEEFNLLFNNSFNDQGYDKSTIQKYPGLEEQDIIYAQYNIKEEKDQKYSVNINLPVFNVNGEVAAEFNNITQSVFANKAEQVLNRSEKYTIYNVEYVAYLNENILSLAIKSTLKEGNSAQRVIIQTYNYDIETGRKLTLNDVLDQYGIEKKQVNQKIEKEVEEANRQAEAVSEALSQTGQSIYKRDINNAMYVTDNVNNFLVGQDGEIYIIYAYGNSNFTSEMDIIKI